MDGGAVDGGAGDGGGPFVPAADITFQMQLQGELDTAIDAALYIIDIDSPSADFRVLLQAGRRIVCHFSAGTVETFRDDADDIPEGARGNTLDDYPNERWLDVSAPSIRSVMRARLERATANGCSAVLPTNLAVHRANSGLNVSEAQAVDFARWLANEAASLGLSAMLGSEALALTLATEYQMALATGCLETDACKQWAPFRDQGKAVLVVAVGDASTAPALCAKARDAGLNAIIKQSDFGAFRVGCR
jgi:hypothetical protein